MAIYRGSGINMYKKYQAKFNPTVIATRFTDIRDLALERAQEGLGIVGTVRELVRPILDKYGITAGVRATYLAFALKLAKHVLRSKDEGAKKIANGLKNYFVTAYGLDPSILDEIIQVVAGYVIPY